MNFVTENATSSTLDHPHQPLRTTISKTPLKFRIKDINHEKRDKSMHLFPNEKDEHKYTSSLLSPPIDQVLLHPAQIYQLRKLNSFPHEMNFTKEMNNLYLKTRKLYHAKKQDDNANKEKFSLNLEPLNPGMSKWVERKNHHNFASKMLTKESPKMITQGNYSTIEMKDQVLDDNIPKELQINSHKIIRKKSNMFPRQISHNVRFPGIKVQNLTENDISIDKKDSSRETNQVLPQLLNKRPIKSKEKLGFLVQHIGVQKSSNKFYTLNTEDLVNNQTDVNFQIRNGWNLNNYVQKA